MIHRALVVIRTAGERTAGACEQLVLAQGVPCDQIVVIRQAPFELALRATYEAGIGRESPWTLCVDGDVLLRPDSIELMLRRAEGLEATALGLQGYILDKFTGGPRHGGVHLYRTKLLGEAKEILLSQGSATRPERDVLRTMDERGHAWVQLKYLSGLHDFEQFYVDLYRKCFVHAHKHLYRAEQLVEYWRSMAAADPDFGVALRGFAAGVVHLGGVSIDAAGDLYANGFATLGMDEKSPMPGGAYSLDHVEHMIEAWELPEAYRTRWPDRMGLDVPEEEECRASRCGCDVSPSRRPRLMRLVGRCRQHSRQHGPVRTFVHALGWCLRRSGEYLQSMVQG